MMLRLRRRGGRLVARIGLMAILGVGGAVGLPATASAAQGCGPGFHRNVAGFCVPNGHHPAPRPCPRGYHPTPFGCKPNV
jgi:hypothetical protein